MGMPIIIPSNTTRPQAITDIIESVALEQTALSHILNAEGEKIQKVVASATTAQQMLDVNKSVEQMVNSIARLEMVLQSKLELFSDCLCPPTSSTSSTTTTSTTTTTTTTTCAPVSVAINKTQDTATFVTQSSPTTFSLMTLASSVKPKETFSIVAIPSGLPISFGTLPTEVTTSGTSFSIDWEYIGNHWGPTNIYENSFTFTVGTGACAKTITVTYSMIA